VCRQAGWRTFRFSLAPPQNWLPPSAVFGRWAPQTMASGNFPYSSSAFLHADQHRRRQLLIKPLRIAAGMHQFAFSGFSRLRVQPVPLLPTGMEITPYNHHCEDSFLPSVFDPQAQAQDYRLNRAFALIQSIVSRSVRKGGTRCCRRPCVPRRPPFTTSRK
jgi:hypothetical protein